MNADPQVVFSKPFTLSSTIPPLFLFLSFIVWVCLSISVCLSLFLCVALFLPLSVSVYLSVCLSVCLSLSLARSHSLLLSSSVIETSTISLAVVLLPVLWRILLSYISVDVNFVLRVHQQISLVNIRCQRQLMCKFIDIRFTQPSHNLAHEFFLHRWQPIFFFHWQISVWNREGSVHAKPLSSYFQQEKRWLAWTRDKLFRTLWDS